jgi:hypothetical protein
MNILKIIQKELQFNYTLVLSADNRYGSEQADGQWSGQIGLLDKNELDISIMELTVTSQRAEVLFCIIL